MPTTFDLSDAGSASPQPPRPEQNDPGRGTGLPLDDFARPVLMIAVFAIILALGYMMWGMFSGAWGNAHFMQMAREVRVRQINNIHSCSTVLQIASLFGVIALLICCFRDELVGYILVAVSIFTYFGFSFLTSQIFDLQGLKPSRATHEVIGGIQHVWWVYGIPGMIWVLGDFVRRFKTASENAAIQRATMKYGADVAKQPATTQNKFLGRCWELPYCRENVRVKCPVYLKKRMPCWTNKQGCMCDERIVLQAVISSDWKQQTANATQQPGLGGISGITSGGGAGLSPLGGGAGGGLSPLGGAPSAPQGGVMGVGTGIHIPPTRALTPKAKAERCRHCIIYNEHQRQKYKLMTGLALVGVPVVLYLFEPQVMGVAHGLVSGLDKISKRFSFDQTPTTTIFSGPQGGPIEWILIGSLFVVLLSQVLKFIEFLCFKLKI